MSNYYLILAWVLVAYVVTRTVRVEKTEYVCGKRVKRPTWWWALIVFLPLVVWAGWRGYVGDTGMYMRAFGEMPSQFSGIPAYMTTVKKDEAYYFLACVIKCLIGNRVNLYLLLIAALQAWLLVRVYRKYSTNYVISFFLFVASTDYISWMFNGARQFVAVTMTFACFELILEKKYIPATILIYIASLFHGSALLVIPFIFIVQGKAWNKKTLLFLAAIVVAVAYVEQFTNVLDTLLAETQYENVVSDWTSWGDDGTNILRVIVYAVPAMLSLVGLKYIHHADDPVINICTNMSIAAVGFYVVSMFTSGIFIGRLPIYFSLYSYMLLPWEIENMFTERSQKLVYGAMMGAYLVFYYYQIHITWALA